jgi:hypothetical protein
MIRTSTGSMVSYLRTLKEAVKIFDHVVWRAWTWTWLAFSESSPVVDTCGRKSGDFSPNLLPNPLAAS